jgi:hypothetical protein
LTPLSATVSVSGMIVVQARAKVTVQIRITQNPDDCDNAISAASPHQDSTIRKRR